MEKAVSASHAIGLGMFVALHDSLDRDGMQWEWMTFEPTAWLKGNGGAGLLRIYFPQISNATQQKAFSWRQARTRCLVFLRWVKAKKPYWVVDEHPEHPGSGLVRLEDDPSLVWDAIRVIALQRPEAMARRSDLVAIGRARPGYSTIHAYGGPIRANTFHVDSVLVGSDRDSVINVYTPYGAWMEEGSYLVSARRSESGAYEVIGFAAGARRIENGWLKEPRQALSDVSDRIRQSRKLVPGR